MTPICSVTSTRGRGTATSATLLKMVMATEHVMKEAVQSARRRLDWRFGLADIVAEMCTAQSTRKRKMTTTVSTIGSITWCISRCEATADLLLPSIHGSPVIAMGIPMSSPITSGGEGEGEGGGLGGLGGSWLKACCPS